MIPYFKYCTCGCTSYKLTWRINTASLVKKAHQCLYFLRRLKYHFIGTSVLISFSGVWQRTSSLPASPCCMATALLQPKTHCSGYRGLLAAAFPSSLRFIIASTRKRPPVLWQTLLTLLMDCLPPSLQARDYATSRPELSGWETASYLILWDWTIGSRISIILYWGITAVVNSAL